MRDAQLGIVHLLIFSMLVWALPSCLVFLSVVSSGSSLPVAAVAVALSAVRLLPMTIVIMPWLRGERTSRFWLFLASHFVAVTAYVEGLLRLPAIPEQWRLSYFIGLGSGLLLSASIAGVLGYQAAATLPKPLAIGLLFLTPLYFMISLLATTRSVRDGAALGFGLVFGPLAHLVDPEFDLLWAGLIGGTLAYGLRWLPALRERA